MNQKWWKQERVPTWEVTVNVLKFRVKSKALCQSCYLSCVRLRESKHLWTECQQPTSI